MTEEIIRMEILIVERRRCTALIASDISVLNGLMHYDLVHVHGYGKIDGKDAYLNGISNLYVFHRVERGDNNIRSYGDVAVVVRKLRQAVSLCGETR